MVESEAARLPAALPGTSAAKPGGVEQIANALKFAADVAVLPGSSRIVEGDLGRGLLYAGGGILSRYLLPGAFGAFGWVAIGLDAFSVSSSGKHLWELGSRQRAKPPVDEDLSTAS